MFDFFTPCTQDIYVTTIKIDKPSDPSDETLGYFLAVLPARMKQHEWIFGYFHWYTT